MDDKISIILPIFNVGPYLRKGIDSLINQTIGNENLEIIMVNDCSTDGSDKIIDEYAEKYDCCIAIHHEKNSGGAHTPRNTGIDACTGDYIMFLDPDDEYSLDACESLYEVIKKYDADIAFGRYVSVFDNEDAVKKSYSPYIDNLFNEYPNIQFDNKQESKIGRFIGGIITYFVYGISSYSGYSNKIVDIIHVDNIKQEPILLKLAPSVWCKLYKRELIMDNNIRFQQFISGDDMAFSLEALVNANGIVFLNNFISYYYFIRDLPDDKSITRSINIRLLDELLDSYIYVSERVKRFPNNVRILAINHHIVYWFNLWRKSKLTKDENKYLIKKLYSLKKIHSTDFRSQFLLFSVISYIKILTFF